MTQEADPKLDELRTAVEQAEGDVAYEQRYGGDGRALQAAYDRRTEAWSALEAAIRQPYIEAINDVLTDFPECSVMETSIDRTEVCKTHQWVLPCPYARLRALLQPEQGGE